MTMVNCIGYNAEAITEMVAIIFGNYEQQRNGSGLNREKWQSLRHN